MASPIPAMTSPVASQARRIGPRVNTSPLADAYAPSASVSRIPTTTMTAGTPKRPTTSPDALLRRAAGTGGTAGRADIFGGCGDRMRGALAAATTAGGPEVGGGEGIIGRSGRALTRGGSGGLDGFK